MIREADRWRFTETEPRAIPESGNSQKGATVRTRYIVKLLD
jgi:hypothetical protein